MAGVKFSNVAANVPQLWHVPNLYPIGLAVEVGGAGCGKGTLNMRVVGDTTTGTGPLVSNQGDPKSVILVSGEDDNETCTWHRLTASEANLDLITDITWEGPHAGEHPVHDSTKGECNCAPFKIARSFKFDQEDLDRFDVDEKRLHGLSRLEDEIKRINASDQPDVRLVVIDPLNALGGCALRVDNIVRDQIMEPLQAIAKRHHVAIILVHHFNKSGQVGGSQGIVDAARHVLEVVRANSKRTVRIFKTNIANDEIFGGLSYYIVGDTPANTAKFPDHGERLAELTPERKQALEDARARDEAEGIKPRSIRDILGGDK